MFFNILSKLSEVGMSWRGTLLNMLVTRGFFEKKQFRMYKEFTANTTIKMVFTKPFLLTHQSLLCDTGAARAAITTGGTESGTFVAVPTKFCKFLIEGEVLGAATITSGGAVTVGTEREVLRVNVGGGGNAATTGTTLTSIRALPAGTYYVTIAVTGTTTGIYAIEWEEVEPSHFTRN